MAYSSVSSDDEVSPRNRIKFLCSYGGSILPRPSDGNLKYFGGNTRVVSLPRSVSFSQLKERANSILSGVEAAIKYQLAGDDLDALVSVTSDEDLRYMLEEYGRQGQLMPFSPTTSPRFRVFLFPASLSSAPPSFAATPEQRYIDAINGIPVPTSDVSPLNTSGGGGGGGGGGKGFMISSSACSSPRSSMDTSAAGMHKVHSSPNLSSLGKQPSFRHQPQLQKQRSATYYPRTGGGGRGMRVVIGGGFGSSVHYDGIQYLPPPGRVAGAGGSAAACFPRGGCVCCGHVDETAWLRGYPGGGYSCGGCGSPTFSCKQHAWD